MVTLNPKHPPAPAANSLPPRAGMLWRKYRALQPQCRCPHHNPEWDWTTDAAYQARMSCPICAQLGTITIELRKILNDPRIHAWDDWEDFPDLVVTLDAAAAETQP